MKALVSIGFILVAALFFVSSAQADMVNVQLTGVSGGVQGGVYTSPYYATIGNVANVPIVCDDYAHEVYMYESWTAQVSTFSDLSSVRFWQGSQADTLKLYDEAAYLFNELFLNPAQSGDISFALWAVFDPSQVETSAGWDSNAAAWLTSAQNQTYTAGEFSNLEILTPIKPTSPQEYFVRTPEPSAILLLVIGLLSVFLMKRRRTCRPAQA